MTTPDDAWIAETAPYLAPREPGRTDAWTEQAARRGRRGGQRLLHAGEVEAPTPSAPPSDCPPVSAWSSGAA
ncbi:hypothetical protein [Streptomyces sp. KL110A]|uniref:hypothetical protein n=1 Tax=Streptomyces sp. KL110A TaxID=3384221 RepID=UPI0038C2CF13